MIASFRWSLALCAVLVAISSTQAAEQVFRGDLATGDKVHKDRMAFVDYHIIEAEAGQLLTITMVPGRDVDLDTYLEVTGPSGQEYSNDDDYEIDGSRLVIPVPESGEWEIAATGYDEDATGAYVVTATIQTLKPILGERGELEEGDDVLLKYGEYYDKFEVEVQAGKTYVVRAASRDFDTFISVHYPGGLVVNDDAAGTTAMSLASFTPGKAGTVTIVITSVSAEEEGRYALAAYEAMDSE